MIYFFCNNNLHFFIDYINSIKYNYKNIEIIDNINVIDYESTYIFIQFLPFISPEILNKLKYYVLNTEQLSRFESINIINNYFLDYNISLIDYSRGNIQCLQNGSSKSSTTISEAEFIQKNNSKVHYLPYMVNKNEIYNYEKIYDIAVIGCWNDEYRQNITNNISNIHIIEGFGIERDEQLFKHKILLNIHYNKNFKIFEQMRCNRCIFNKMIVITEFSIDIDYEL
jgi:hypothetical protein